jgi:hypothetical protein
MNDQPFEEFEHTPTEEEDKMTEQTTTPQAQAYTSTEAPASFTICYMQGGYDCMLTLRGVTGTELLAKAEKIVDYLNAHNATPQTNGNGHGKPAAAAPAPATPAPATGNPPKPAEKQADDEGETMTVEVKSMAHCVTDSGKHHVRIKGGKFSKFGVKAWPEVLPQEAQDYETWTIGEEFTPYDGMKWATITGNKVTRFSKSNG